MLTLPAQQAAKLYLAFLCAGVAVGACTNEGVSALCPALSGSNVDSAEAFGVPNLSVGAVVQQEQQQRHRSALYRHEQ